MERPVGYRKMTIIQTLVRVIESFDLELPDPPGRAIVSSSSTILSSIVTTTARREVACRRVRASALQARIQDS
jgi:hypothetical protein